MSAIAPRDEQRPTIKTPQELVHIKHKITLLQYKYWVLMLRTYREAYEEAGKSLADTDYCYLSMAKLAEHLGYDPKTSEIEKDLEAIRKEPIIFNVLEKDGRKGKTGRGFITEWYVSSNRVGVIFPPMIREAIENLDNKESIFHLLNWSVFNSFTGKYEAVLYKLCKDYLGWGKTPYMPLDKFRGYMGVKDSDYPDFKRLNQWVISGPIKRINESELSDIVIRAELRREVRKVVGVTFHMESKKQTSMDFGDDPAFRFAKVTISLAQQRQYLSSKPGEQIEHSIERANEYAEDQEKQGKPISNLGALYRKAIEEDWGKEYQAKQSVEAEKKAKEEAKRIEERAAREAEKKAELRTEFSRITTTSRITALTREERRAYALEWLNTDGQGRADSYDETTGKFRNERDNQLFSIFLRTRVGKLATDEEFAEWLKNRKG